MATTTPRKRSKQPEPDPTPELVPVADLFEDEDSEVEEPLLELSLLEPVRPTILIKTRENRDGKLYELRELNDFDLLQQHALKRDGGLFDRLWKKDVLNKTESAKLMLLLDRLFDQALIIPDGDDLKRQLSDSQRAAVITVFMQAPTARAMARLMKAQDNEEARDGSTMAS